MNAKTSTRIKRTCKHCKLKGTKARPLVNSYHPACETVAILAGTR